MDTKSRAIALLAVMVLIACGKNSGITKVDKPGGGRSGKGVIELSKIQYRFTSDEVEKEVEDNNKNKKIKNRRKTLSARGGKTCLSLQKLKKEIQDLNDRPVIVSSFDLDVQFEGSKDDTKKKILASLLATENFKPRMDITSAMNLVTKQGDVEYVAEFLREIGVQTECSTIKMDRPNENGSAALAAVEFTKVTPQSVEFPDQGLNRKIHFQNDNLILTKTIEKVSICGQDNIKVTQSFVVNFNPNSNTVRMSPAILNYIKIQSKYNLSTAPTPYALQLAIKRVVPDPKQVCAK